MFEREATLCRFLLGYADSLLADVPQSAATRQPWTGANHPLWTLGHLALVADRMLERFGVERTVPDEWDALFGTGSQPQDALDGYPPKEELEPLFRDRYEKLAESAPSLTEELASKPNPIAFLRDGLPTYGDLLAHVLTTHLAMHLGQLSAWKRATGHPPLF